LCGRSALKVARFNKEWERAQGSRGMKGWSFLRSCAFSLFLDARECAQSQTSVLDVDRVWQFGCMFAPSLWFTVGYHFSRPTNNTSFHSSSKRETIFTLCTLTRLPASCFYITSEKITETITHQPWPWQFSCDAIILIYRVILIEITDSLYPLAMQCKKSRNAWIIKMIAPNKRKKKGNGRALMINRSYWEKSIAMQRSGKEILENT